MSNPQSSPMSLSGLSLTVKIIVGLLAAALLKEKSAALNDFHPVAGSAMKTLMFLPEFWVSLVAPVMYLCALWAASEVFRRMDKGDAFGPSMVKGLKEVGSNMMYGAAAAIFLAPTLIFLIENQFSRMTGLKYHFEIESLTIGLIGLVLFLLARQGQTLKQELEQFV